MRFCTVPSSVPNACIVWILLKMPYSPALASLADTKLLDFQYSIATFYLYVVIHVHEQCIYIYGMYVFNHWHMREGYVR